MSHSSANLENYFRCFVGRFRDISQGEVTVYCSKYYELRAYYLLHARVMLPRARY